MDGHHVIVSVIVCVIISGTEMLIVRVVHGRRRRRRGKPAERREGWRLASCGSTTPGAPPLFVAFGGSGIAIVALGLFCGWLLLVAAVFFDFIVVDGRENLLGPVVIAFVLAAIVIVVVNPIDGVVDLGVYHSTGGAMLLRRRRLRDFWA